MRCRAIKVYQDPRDMGTGEICWEDHLRMVELDVTFVHTTGTAGRPQGVHKEAGRSVRICEETAPCKGGDIRIYPCYSCTCDSWKNVELCKKEQIWMIVDETCCPTAWSTDRRSIGT